MNYFLVTIEFSSSSNCLVNLTNAIETQDVFFTFNDIATAARKSGHEIRKSEFSIRFIFKMTRKQYLVWTNSFL